MPSEASSLSILTSEDRTLLIGCLDHLLNDWSAREPGDSYPVWTAEDAENAAGWLPLYRTVRDRLAAMSEAAEATGPVVRPQPEPDLARHMDAEVRRIADIRQGLTGPGETVATVGGVA